MERLCFSLAHFQITSFPHLTDEHMLSLIECNQIICLFSTEGKHVQKLRTPEGSLPYWAPRLRNGFSPEGHTNLHKVEAKSASKERLCQQDDSHHWAWAPPPRLGKRCWYSQLQYHNISYIPRGRCRQLCLGKDEEPCQQEDIREIFPRFTFLK